MTVKELISYLSKCDENAKVELSVLEGDDSIIYTISYLEDFDAIYQSVGNKIVNLVAGSISQG